MLTSSNTFTSRPLGREPGREAGREGKLPLARDEGRLLERTTAPSESLEFTLITFHISLFNYALIITCITIISLLVKRNRKSQMYLINLATKPTIQYQLYHTVL